MSPTSQYRPRRFRSLVIFDTVHVCPKPHTVLDFTLEVGSVDTKVEVKGSAPLLNSASAALGQVMENKFIAEMPILDPQIIALAFLAPGVNEI